MRNQRIPIKENLLILGKNGNEYTIWWSAREAPKTEKVTSNADFKVGDWVTYDDSVFKSLHHSPIPTSIIKKGNECLVKVIVVVVRPLPEYFDSANRLDKKRYKKYFGVANKLGPIFINGGLCEQMEPGVPYELQVASFGIIEPTPEDQKVLNAMKGLGTIWLASKQTLHRAKSDILLAAQMRAGYDINMHDSACTSFSTEQPPPDPHSPQYEVASPMAEEFDSELSKSMTRSSIEKMLNNVRICDAMRAVGAEEDLNVLRALLA